MKIIRLAFLAGFVAVSVITFPMWRGFLPTAISAMLPTPAGQTPAVVEPAVVQNTVTAPGVSDPLVIDPVVPTTLAPATAAPIVVSGSGTQTITGSTAPAPTAAPTPAPTAAPVLTSSAAWANNADCSIALAYLHEDAVWDHDTSVGLANGSLTTYPIADAAVYASWSSRWYTLYAEANALCPGGEVGPTSIAPSAAQITQADAWMTEAIGNHTYDAQHVPGDASWDAQWSATYAALIAQWNALVVA